MIVRKLVSALAVALFLAAPVARAGRARHLQIAQSGTRARSRPRGARRMPQARLSGGGRGGGSLRRDAGHAARPLRRCPHTGDGGRQGLDRGKLPHQHDGTGRIDAARHAAGGAAQLPGAVILGGGLVIEAGGSLVGAVGVSGAPGGDADDACAKAGIEAVRDRLDF